MQNNRKFLLMWLTMLSCICGLWGCSDSDEVAPSDTQLLIDCEVPDAETYSRYYTLSIDIRNLEDSTVTISSDAAWLIPQVEVWPNDGYVDVLVEENDADEGREAEIILTETRTGRVGRISFYQKGLNDLDANGGGNSEGNVSIGYGYNAFGEYQNAKSICDQIVDLNQLAQYDAEDKFQSTQEVVRGVESFEMESSYTLQEMSTILTKKIETTVNLWLYKKTITRFETVRKDSTVENCYGYARLVKAVASHSIDRGVLIYLRDTQPNNMPFSTAFKSLYANILRTKGNTSQCRSYIQKMLKQYGTHLVVSTLSGGTIDYVVCFDKKYKGTVETKTKEQSTYLFGKTKTDTRSETTKKSINNIDMKHSISLSGGSKTTRNALQADIDNLGTDARLNSDKFKAWVASITYTQPENLTAIDFGLMPIWDLFADQTIYSLIQAEVSKMNQQSNNVFTDKELGLDNYRFSIAQLDLSFDPNGSLVKVFYDSDNKPYLEVCSEYVPKIRTDRRVTVIYPIIDGVTRMNQGIFIGDGDGNPPAQLVFTDDDVYVTNVSDRGPNDVLDSLYLVHGNLYASPYGTWCKETTPPRNGTLQYFQLSDKMPKYPIVKIANLYWTRNDLREEMDFGGTDFLGNWAKMERLIGGVLYANAYQSCSSSFESLYRNVWGLTVDGYGYRNCWYVPLEEDRQNLTKYIGRNLKALFPGQVSGFDAKFLGYWGPYELTTGDDDDDFDGVHCSGVNKYSCIPFKKTLSTSRNTGEVMVLTSDYAWFKADSIAANNNYYPVRVVRTSWRPYPDYHK
jgi:hypothetical protein